MSLLANLFQQQQAINQQPTSTVRTPVQTAYDNYLNAQANTQNTKEDEWGSAIGNSINGLAKIIASSVIKDPFEKAGATRNLDNFDARQDALVRQWAMERAKKRNDFVNQAREQLGLAREDEQQAYDRDWKVKQDAYNRMLTDRDWENKLKQQDIQNKNTDRQLTLLENRLDFDKEKYDTDNFMNVRNGDRNYELEKRKIELAEKQFAQKQAELENKAGVDTVNFDDYQKGLLKVIDTALSKGEISDEDYALNLQSIAKNRELSRVKSNKKGGLLNSITDVSQSVVDYLNPKKTTYQDNNKVTISEIK